MEKDLPVLLDDRLFLSIRETREVFGISPAHFYRLVGQGKLRIAKSGKKSLVPVDSVRAYAAEIDPEFSGQSAEGA